MTDFKLSAQAWPLPLWIAHRGAGKLAPENTLAAFREGARHGWRAFECDVKLSADDVPFLLHDTELDRTTPQRGVASQRPWSELSRTDAGAWHSRAYAGEPLPSLQSIATYLQANGFALDLEIKPTPGDEERTGRLVAAEVARLWAGQSQVPLLSSFNPESLQGAQQVAPQLPRALLVDELWTGWWDVAQSLGCVAVITNHRLMDAALIQRLHAAGLRALVYTVNDAEVAQRLLTQGIDGIITDAVDQFSPCRAG
jgi:glycerophosphoryl diester phosphodiesterase